MRKVVEYGIIHVVGILLLSPNVCMGQEYSSGGAAVSVIVPLLICFILFIMPIIKAYIIAKEAEKFKTLVFIKSFYESLGWLLCLTIIGIPVGLGFVLLARSCTVLIKIEANTSQTLTLLKFQNGKHD